LNHWKLNSPIVSYHDPYFPVLLKGRHYDLQMKRVPLDNLGSYDCVVIGTDHSDYDYAAIVRETQLVVDTRNRRAGSIHRTSFVAEHPTRSRRDERWSSPTETLSLGPKSGWARIWLSGGVATLETAISICRAAPLMNALGVVMKSKSITFATLTLLAVLSIAGMAQDRAGPAELRAPTSPSPAQAAPSATSDTPAPDLLIGAGDLLDVSLYGISDFKAEGRVDSRGEVSLPMVGSVAVGGVTVEQAEKLIKAKLVEAQLYNDPQVTVFVKEYASQGISVMGEVQKPGIYQLLGSKRLYDAISAAGGTTPKAGRYVLITRRGDPDHPVKVPLSSDAKSMENNVPIGPGDTVFVSKAGLVYVVGDVKLPGGFVMENDKNITVLQAIALAQGIGPNPSLNKAKLIRNGPEGRKDIPLPLKQILASKAPDMELQADDIIFIPDSLSMSAAKRSAESIVSMATGIAIWKVP